MQAEETQDERDAVDALLGPAATGWEGGTRSALDGHVGRGGREARSRRHLLLPALHALQSRAGWISPGGMNYLCTRLSVPPAEAYGVASFYAMFSTQSRPSTVVHVCDDIACRVNGAKELCAELEQQLGPAGQPAMDGRLAWTTSPCLGMCDAAPAVFFQRPDHGSPRGDASIARASVPDVLSSVEAEPGTTLTSPGRIRA